MIGGVITLCLYLAGFTYTGRRMAAACKAGEADTYDVAWPLLAVLLLMRGIGWLLAKLFGL